jgi:hypothetical protein
MSDHACVGVRVLERTKEVRQQIKGNSEKAKLIANLETMVVGLLINHQLSTINLAAKVLPTS